MSRTPRQPTALDAVADRLVDDVCALDPFTATTAGVAGHERELTDFSPAGFAARTELDRRTLAAVERLAAGAAAPGAVDPVDAVTLAAALQDSRPARQDS